MLKANHIINDTLSHYIKQTSFEKELLLALHALLNSHFIKYNFEQNFTPTSKNAQNQPSDTFQKIFSACHRKERGIYYTQADVADFIVANAISANFLGDKRILSTKAALDKLSQMPAKSVQRLIFEQSFFDPTCGSGEFLLSVVNFKIKLAEKCGLNLSDLDYIRICATALGNDIESESIDIAKMRIFFAILPRLKNSLSFSDLALALNQCFWGYDFVLDFGKIKQKFDFIVGNPPYVEYAKYGRKKELATSYGNIYADVIANSLNLLKASGGLGFVLPLSYISTARMQKIRALISENCEKQVILSFADRPDCLFVGAHQKINILIAKKGSKPCKTYTSNYKHWYKNEREFLLNGLEIIATKAHCAEFVPKIGNKIELSIYNKARLLHENNLISIQKQSGKSVFLNMRACFWIKAFRKAKKSKEYNEFKFDDEMRDFVLCVLNSSLFWIFWTMVSDGWHLTSKELRHFSVPAKIENTALFKKLAQNLEQKLEKTKLYINTAQTDYEYKHKLCKNEIDDIDKALARLYNLTKNELNYIQNFALKYRLGDNKGA